MMTTRPLCVALLAEGVDRNSCFAVAVVLLALSPSSRRAWIEIEIIYQATTEDDVALLAEGVDRNSYAILQEKRRISRPPRGGRG